MRLAVNRRLCSDMQFRRHIEFNMNQARALEGFAGVHIAGTNDASLRRGQNNITVMQDLDVKRLLFATAGRDHKTMVEFAADLRPTSEIP